MVIVCQLSDVTWDHLCLLDLWLVVLWAAASYHMFQGTFAIHECLLVSHEQSLLVTVAVKVAMCSKANCGTLRNGL